MDTQYVIDEGNIIFEEMDNELVIINLQTGCYYSLNEDAARVWRLACGGFTLGDMAGGDAGADRRREAVGRILGQFEAEQLLQKAPARVGKDESLHIDPDSLLSPVMQRHEDIQEMLRLDPIHEVTDLGWPHKDA